MRSGPVDYPRRAAVAPAIEPRRARDGIPTADSGMVGVVMGMWLSGVFIASLLGRSESEGLVTQALLAVGVLWPLLYFMVSSNRFFPAVPNRGTALAIFLFAVFAGASVFVSPIIWTSLAYYVMTLSAIFMALQFNTALTQEQYRIGLALYAGVMGVLLSVYAVHHYHPGIRLGNDDVTAVFNPNSIGIMTVSVIAASMSIKTWAGKLVILIPVTGVLILTDSRASTLGALIAVAVIWATMEKRGGILVKLSIIMSMMIGAVLAAIYWNSILGAVTKFLALNNSYRGLGSGATGRLDAWKAAWDLFLSSPVVGVGFRAHESIVESITGTESSAHNGYLALLAEIGIVGSLSVLYMVIAGIRRLKRLAGSTKGVVSISVLLGICCGYCFVALFERYLLNVGNPTSLLFMLGIFYNNRNVAIGSKE